MDDLQALGAAAVGLKPAVDLAKSLIDALGTGKGREQAVKLYGEILSAQQNALTSSAAQALLIQEKDALKARIAELETWNGEKERYKLKDIGGGVLAYALKMEAQGVEPIHSLCPKCYQHRQKSILQRETRAPGRAVYMACHECKLDFLVHGMRF